MVLNGKRLFQLIIAIPVYNQQHKIIDTVQMQLKRCRSCVRLCKTRSKNLGEEHRLRKRVSILIKAAGILEENSKETADSCVQQN